METEKIIKALTRLALTMIACTLVGCLLLIISISDIVAPVKVKVVNTTKQVDTVYIKNTVITYPHKTAIYDVNVATIRGYEPKGYEKNNEFIFTNLEYETNK